MTLPHELFIAFGIFCILAAGAQLTIDTRRAVNGDIPCKGASATVFLLGRYVGTLAALYMVIRAAGIL